MNSKESLSSATSSSTDRHTRALVISTCGLHMACTVLLKCHPWWIKGSPAWLHHDDGQINLHRRLQTHSVFLFGALRVLTWTEGSPADSSKFLLVIEKDEKDEKAG